MSKRRSPQWLVYQATNLINGKRYVGFTGQSLAGRRAGHKGEALDPKRKKRPFTYAIRFHGIEFFRFALLKRCTSKAEAAGEEVRLIGLLKPDYNVTPGGDTALAPTPDQFALFMAGRAAASERRKRPVICLSDGRIFGSAKEAALAYDVSPALICKAVNGQRMVAVGRLFSFYTGREVPLADPATVVRAIKGEQRDRMVARTPRKAIIRLNDGARFGSVTAAAEAINARIAHVSRVLIGGRPHHRGWRFAYAEAK